MSKNNFHSTKKSFNDSNFNNSNVTLFKSKYSNNKLPFSNKEQNFSTNQKNNVENDYIENLRKQIYFMEMELKLMKEREKEIEKSGGFNQLFNDDRDPSQHIVQLKLKYSNMRKVLQTKIEELTNKKNVLSSENVSIKAKYEVAYNLEKEAYDNCQLCEQFKSKELERLENENKEYFIKRNELEALNKMNLNDIDQSKKLHKDFDFNLRLEAKMYEINNSQYEKCIKQKDEINSEKSNEYINIHKRINELQNISTEDPVVQLEIKKNAEYKQKIANIDNNILSSNLKIEELEIVNEYLIKKKEEMITERKKFVIMNEDLKREIEQKNQLNDMRISKKVKDNNFEEINIKEQTCIDINNKADDFEKKILVEYNKIKSLSKDIIELNYNIKSKNSAKEKKSEIIEQKYSNIDELKENLEENIRPEYVKICNDLNKNSTTNEELKNKNILLSKEYEAVMSKYYFILNNFDTDSYLKKISIEDMKVLTQTNNLVNESIFNFVDKIGNFKSNQVNTKYLNL